MGDNVDAWIKDTDPDGALHKIALLAKTWEQKATAAEQRGRKRDVVVFWLGMFAASGLWWAFQAFG
jgi:hypothetical protein